MPFWRDVLLILYLLSWRWHHLTWTLQARLIYCLLAELVCVCSAQLFTAEFLPCTEILTEFIALQAIRSRAITLFNVKTSRTSEKLVVIGFSLLSLLLWVFYSLPQETGKVMVEKSCCNDLWGFVSPVLHQISNLVQWLTKKSSEWGKDQLNENEATFMAFPWRN